jgi:RNA polymerase primary sigma factor
VKKLEDEGWNIVDIANKFKVSVQNLQEAINQRQEEIDTLIGDVFKDNDSAKSNSEIISNSPSQLDVEELSAQITDIGVPKEIISEALDNFLSGLKDRQAQIIRLRFGLKDGKCHTLEEIGRNMNLSRERIRQLKQKALVT